MTSSICFMTDVAIEYPSEHVDRLTTFEFDTFPSGMELVVAEKLQKETKMGKLLDEASAQENKYSIQVKTALCNNSQQTPCIAG